MFHLIVSKVSSSHVADLVCWCREGRLSIGRCDVSVNYCHV